jgi:SPP1 gp7 family putative phage head morphogenesis protein
MDDLKYIDRILNDIIFDDLAKKDLFEEMLIRTKQFKVTNKLLREGLHKQIADIVYSNVFSDITDRIGKVSKPILTDTDRKAIDEEVARIFKGLEDYIQVEKFDGFIKWSTEIGGQRLLNELGIGKKYSLTNTAYLKTIGSYRNLLLKGVDRTTKKWIAETIYTGKENQLTNAEIEKILKEKMPDISRSRAETIIRTEMNNAVNKGELETAIRNKASEKSWRVAEDERLCEICNGNGEDGWVGLGANFRSGHDSPPAHPNCRCDLRYKFPPVSDVIWAGE